MSDQATGLDAPDTVEESEYRNGYKAGRAGWPEAPIRHRAYYEGYQAGEEARLREILE